MKIDYFFFGPFDQYGVNSFYLDASLDRNFSEQSGFLEAVLLHHLVHTFTAQFQEEDIRQ